MSAVAQVLQPSVHAAILAASAAVSLVLLAVAVQYRSVPVARPVGVLFAAATLWAGAVAARLAFHDAGVVEGLLDLRVAAASPVGALYFWVVVEYLDRDDLDGAGRLLALFVVPAVTVLLLATDVRADLVVQAGRTVEHVDPLFGVTRTVEPEFGAWFYANAAYNYVMIGVGVALLIRSLFADGIATAYRGQTTTLLLAILFPLGVNVGYHAGLIAVDLTAASFSIGLALFSLAIFRYELFTLVPIARDTAVENADEGFVVLDHEDRIVDSNPAAAAMVESSPSALVERHVTDVYSQYARIADEHDRTEEFSGEFVTRDGEAETHYDVTASPIRDGRGRYVGRVLLVQDVTERVRRKQRLEERTVELTRRTDELERQNERLEEFASVLSHDLRNPLAVAETYLERARTGGDPEDFEAIEESLDQIGRYVEDLLTMARHGQTVQDRTWLALETVAGTAWGHVETGDATLVIDTDVHLRADETRLLQVFENLFRNAVEHAAARTAGTTARGDTESSHAAVSVAVGDLDDGFYVEDDGPGIPPQAREEVFERGYTTETDGTGLGLSIVQLAVEAHGWSVGVTESEIGGARFEIREVESIDESPHDTLPGS